MKTIEQRSLENNHIIQSVTFFGSSTGHPGIPNYDNAYQASRIIAASGRRIVNGGGPGTMLAATMGAKEVGGKSAVVYYHPHYATKFEGKKAENMADEHYEESNYIMRTKKLLELGDAYVVFNGGTGTISEMSMAWGLARLYFGHHKPLLLYGEFWHPLMQEFKERMMIRREEFEVFTIVTTPGEALEALEKYEGILEHNRRHHIECEGEECSFFLL
jgi:predicted Rossmann-fold nucleotide-binding protein